VEPGEAGWQLELVHASADDLDDHKRTQASVGELRRWPGHLDVGSIEPDLVTDLNTLMCGVRWWL
jgi:hypothetical protein